MSMDPKELGFKALMFLILALIVVVLIMKLPEIVSEIKIISMKQTGEMQYCSDEPVGKFVWPTRGLADGSKVVVSCMGSRDTSTCTTVCSASHKGIDIRGYRGNDVLAAADGRVVFVGGNYNTVVIDHGDGYKTRYLHNDKIHVTNGESVRQNDIIAEIGGYGPKGRNMYPDHLHFEILRYEEAVDPLCFYDREALNLQYANTANCYYNKELYSYNDEIKGNTLYA